MSYSFGVTAGSKADAIAQVAAEFDKVVSNQPPHAADKDAAVAAASGFIALLREPAGGEQITVSMYGSLGWEQAGDNPPSAFISGGVSISASVTSKA
jgi:hypothetical protein